MAWIAGGCAGCRRRADGLVVPHPGAGDQPRRSSGPVCSATRRALNAERPIIRTCAPRNGLPSRMLVRPANGWTDVPYSGQDLGARPIYPPISSRRGWPGRQPCAAATSDGPSFAKIGIGRTRSGACVSDIRADEAFGGNIPASGARTWTRPPSAAPATAWATVFGLGRRAPPAGYGAWPAGCPCLAGGLPVLGRRGCPCLVGGLLVLGRRVARAWSAGCSCLVGGAARAWSAGLLVLGRRAVGGGGMHVAGRGVRPWSVC
jgi:hypothetical protein